MYTKQFSDSDRELLVSLRDLAGPDANLAEALEAARVWLGIQEDRPATLVEVISYLLAHRGEEPAPRPHPPAEEVAGPVLRRIAGDAYGVMGRVADRSRWPFDAIRSPLAVAHGKLTRLYVAIALGAWHHFHLWPTRWPLLINGLRLAAGLVVGALLCSVTGPIAIALTAGYALGSAPFVNRTLSMPVAVALFNTSLAVAVRTFPETIERAKQAK